MSRKETEPVVNVVQDGSQSSSCVRRTCESDSCWSWLVCGVCALCNIIICGLTYSYGILFPSLLDEFKQGKATTGMRNFFESRCCKYVVDQITTQVTWKLLFHFIPVHRKRRIKVSLHLSEDSSILPKVFICVPFSPLLLRTSEHLSDFEVLFWAKVDILDFTPGAPWPNISPF